MNPNNFGNYADAETSRYQKAAHKPALSAQDFRRHKATGPSNWSHDKHAQFAEFKRAITRQGTTANQDERDP